MSIRQAVEDNCQIINMSLRVSYPIVPAVREAVKYAHSKGVIMVCAAGNDGDNNPFTNKMYTFPVRWSETISVAAVSKSSGVRTQMDLKLLLTQMRIHLTLGYTPTFFSSQWLGFPRAILKSTLLVLELM